MGLWLMAAQESFGEDCLLVLQDDAKSCETRQLSSQATEDVKENFPGTLRTNVGDAQAYGTRSYRMGQGLL